MADIKTIQINPALFQSSNKKTRKVREKKQNVIISTNTLRAKLLKRVSEHKKNEKNGKNWKNDTNDKNDSEIDKSIEYLNNLKPNLIEPVIEKKIIQIKIAEPQITNSDFVDSVNYLNTLQNNNIPQVSLDDYPVELTDCSTKYNVDADVPYGILKNGLKPTYRNWKQTRKVFEEMPPEVADITNINPLPNISQCISPRVAQKEVSKELPRINIPPNSNVAGIKKIIKTMRVQHKLGRSNNVIGVLIKNNVTRKNISNAQTEIKKTPIADITSYLRKHGLMRSGSIAPNDVIRKTYESAMLSGDVTNNNNEILLENYMNEI